MLFQLLSLTSLFGIVSALTEHKNVALYWGQGNYGSLEKTCTEENADIILLAFLDAFGTSDDDLNFSGICSTTFDSGLLHCPDIAADIKTCQSLGKTIMLSLGGASGNYGFTDDTEAETYATQLWNTFGGGSDDSVSRPFDDAVIDGFDFDIESNSATGYAALATKLRTLFAEDSSKSYYLSAAPQCPYPDASVGNMMISSYLDFAFIQFFNNYCSVDGGSFNWDTWVDYAKEVSPNPDIKLFLGLPASSSAAGSGYITPDDVQSALDTISVDENFGGIMLWSAYWSNLNQIDGDSYSNKMQELLDDLNLSDTESTSTTSKTSTTTTSTTHETTATTQKTTSTTSSTTTTTSSTTTSTTSSTSSTTTTTSETTTISTSTTSIKAFGDPEAYTIDTTFQMKPVESTLVTITTSSTTTTAEPTATKSSTATGCSLLSGLQKAKCLNSQFSNGLYLGDENTCTEGEIACSKDGAFAICNFGKWVDMNCAAGTTCYAYNSDDTVDVGCNYIDTKTKFVKREGGFMELIKRNLVHAHHAHE